MEYRQQGSLAEQSAHLVERHAAVIVADGNVAAQTAKSATSTIPIVFTIGGDPVSLGLVASLNRPGGNVTGISLLTTVSEAKRLELLSELVPQATKIAMLVNPNSATTEAKLRELGTAAGVLRRQLHVFEASREHEDRTGDQSQDGVGIWLGYSAAPYRPRRRGHRVRRAR